jgi:Helix-turn-helix domain
VGNPDSAWKSPPELAREWRVDPSKILGWLKSGELKGVNLAASTSGRSRWRISPQAIEAFLANRTASPPPKPVRRRRSTFQRKYYV